MNIESRLLSKCSPSGNTIKILVVDDCKVNQFAISGLLSMWKLDYDLSDNGYNALEKVSGKFYDLIFLDIQMPGIDGYETARKIRAMEGNYFKNIPILAISANLLSELRANSLKNGINDYLGKPFTEEELIAKMESLLPDC